MEKSLLLEAYLKQLRLPAVGRHYQDVARQVVKRNFSYEAFLQALLQLEAQRRIRYSTSNIFEVLRRKPGGFGKSADRTRSARIEAEHYQSN